MIEGSLQSGQKVLVIEDLISTGGSSVKAVAALREAGAEVVGVLAIFTYGFAKATQTFEDADCLFTTLSDYHTLLAQARQQEYINAQQEALLAKWRQAPDSWQPLDA